MKQGSKSSPRCYFHPTEAVVGVCAFCLKERLLVLASKQGRLSRPTGAAQRRTFSRVTRSSSRFIPKVFSLGSSFLHRKPSPPPDYTSSLEDSFISIKFGDDGRASWDKKKSSGLYIYNNGKAAGEGGTGRNQSVVEHARSGGMLRWRKRMGHLLEVIRWRRSASAQTGKVEVGKRGREWIRSLTRRRTATSST